MAKRSPKGKIPAEIKSPPTAKSKASTPKRSKTERELASVIAKAIDGYHAEHPRLTVKTVVDALAHVACALVEVAGERA